MVKKNKDEKSIYERDQVHKKHRGKSEKIMKKIKHKREKKRIKEHNHEQRGLTKYILKVFKEHKKQIELSKLPFDFDEIEKAVGRILSHDDHESVKRIIDAFKKMENSPKEISLSKFENKSIIKEVCKLMKVLKVHQNPNNQLKYSLYYLFTKRSIKTRYTTSVEEIIKECIGSFSLFVKSIFEFHSKDKREKEAKSEDQGKEEEEEEDNEENKKMIINEEGGNDLDKDKLDAEYELIGNEVGQNGDVINRAFHKFLRNDNTSLGHKLQIKNDVDEQKEEEAVKNGPPPSEYLKMTLKLLNESA